MCLFYLNKLFFLLNMYQVIYLFCFTKVLKLFSHPHIGNSGAHELTIVHVLMSQCEFVSRRDELCPRTVTPRSLQNPTSLSVSQPASQSVIHTFVQSCRYHFCCEYIHMFPCMQQHIDKTEEEKIKYTQEEKI